MWICIAQAFMLKTSIECCECSNALIYLKKKRKPSNKAKEKTKSFIISKYVRRAISFIQAVLLSTGPANLLSYAFIGGWLCVCRALLCLFELSLVFEWWKKLVTAPCITILCFWHACQQHLGDVFQIRQLKERLLR